LFFGSLLRIIMAIIHPKLLATALLLFGGVNAQGLSPKKYLPLPLGKIFPSGWLKDQLEIQTKGLAGQQSNFYSYTANSDWTGGTEFYSDLEEAGSYWFTLCFVDI
jgi:hypothetical protein